MKTDPDIKEAAVAVDEKARTVIRQPPLTTVHGHQHQYHHRSSPPPPPPPPSSPSPSPQQQHHHHHHHHGRTAGGVGSLILADYLVEPAVTSPTVVLESAGGGGAAGRRPPLQVNGTGGPHVPRVAVLCPRAMYPPFPLPLPPSAATTSIWHHSQPHFAPHTAAFPPLFEVSRRFHAANTYYFTRCWDSSTGKYLHIFHLHPLNRQIFCFRSTIY